MFIDYIDKISRTLSPLSKSECDKLEKYYNEFRKICEERKLEVILEKGNNEEN